MLWVMNYCYLALCPLLSCGYYVLMLKFHFTRWCAPLHFVSGHSWMTSLIKTPVHMYTHTHTHTQTQSYMYTFMKSMTLCQSVVKQNHGSVDGWLCIRWQSFTLLVIGLTIVLLGVVLLSTVFLVTCLPSSINKCTKYEHLGALERKLWSSPCVCPMGGNYSIIYKESPIQHNNYSYLHMQV